WKLYAYGPITAMLPTDTINSHDYVIVWIADDPSETDNNPLKDGDTGQNCNGDPTCTANPGKGVMAMHAESYGPFGAKRVIVATKASAQLDPLLFLKRCTPNIIFDVDVRNSMLQDADGNYYDPNQYAFTSNGNAATVAWQTALGLSAGVNVANQNNAPYYRKFVNRTYSTGVVNGQAYNFGADSITVVGNLAAGYSTFYEKTRLMVTRRALTQVIDENSNVVRFGLLKMRQTAPAWGTAPNNKLANDAAKISAATVAGATQQVATDTSKTGVWYYMKTTVTGNNGAAAAPDTTALPYVRSDAATANTTVRSLLE